MAQKPNIPKGTRDFGPIEMARRNYIFSTIRSVFFQQIETPAMELMSTLMGKYGEEGDKLLFRIQNSGEKAAEAPEKGLRYDLTVPFARYIVQHREELQFPFRRYQIQPVWRDCGRSVSAIRHPRVLTHQQPQDTCRNSRSHRRTR